MKTLGQIGFRLVLIACTSCATTGEEWPINAEHVFPRDMESDKLERASARDVELMHRASQDLVSRQLIPLGLDSNEICISTLAAFDIVVAHVQDHTFVEFVRGGRDCTVNAGYVDHGHFVYEFDSKGRMLPGND